MRIISVLLLFVSFSASAVPVEWTLQDIVFDQGGTASGSFFYDADASGERYSQINISSTAGAGIPGFDYVFRRLTSLVPTTSLLLLGAFNPCVTAGCPSGEDAPYLALGFDSPLPAAGVASFSGTEGYCLEGASSAICNLPDSYRSFSGTASAVPVPAAVWLFGSALLGLGWVRRRLPS